MVPKTTRGSLYGLVFVLVEVPSGATRVSNCVCGRLLRLARPGVIRSRDFRSRNYRSKGSLNRLPALLPLPSCRISHIYPAFC